LGGARYWNQDLNASVNLKGKVVLLVTRSVAVNLKTI